MDCFVATKVASRNDGWGLCASRNDGWGLCASRNDVWDIENLFELAIKQIWSG